MRPDAHRAEAPDGIEVERRVSRIALAEFEVLLGERADAFGQGVKQCPERRRRVVVQSGRE